MDFRALRRARCAKTRLIRTDMMKKNCFHQDVNRLEPIDAG